MEVIELKKVCAICVAEFEPVKVFQKYCSKSCAQTVNYKPRTKFKNVCAVCGADFEGKKGKKYCSKRCKDKAIYRKKSQALSDLCREILKVENVIRAGRSLSASLRMKNFARTRAGEIILNCR